MMDIKQALATLDPLNDQHWTADGVPLVSAVNSILGAEVTRKQITDAAPTLTRATATAPSEAPQANPSPVAVGDEAVAAVEPPPSDEKGDEATSEPAVKVDEGLLVPDDVCVIDTISIGDILKSASLTDRAMREIQDLSVKKMAFKEQVTEELRTLSKYGQTLSRHLDRFKKNDSATNMSDNQAYLASGQRAREEKAKRANAFLDSGTTADEVAEQLSTKAPIDQALNRGRPKPGSQRPVLPLMNPNT